MNPFPYFDPSKMDPKSLKELTDLIRELPPDQLNRMQTLMHNMMAGFDVSREMADFERNLPPGFRERLAGIMARQAAAPAPTSEPSKEEVPGNMREARLTILRAVSEGKLSPEEAEKLLF